MYSFRFREEILTNCKLGDISSSQENIELSRVKYFLDDVFMQAFSKQIKIYMISSVQFQTLCWILVDYSYGTNRAFFCLIKTNILRSSIKHRDS